MDNAIQDFIVKRDLPRELKILARQVANAIEGALNHNGALLDIINLKKDKILVKYVH